MAEGLRSNKPIHPLWVAYCLNQIRDENTILLNEYTLDVSPMDFSQPQSYFSLSPAGGLGWSIGAALGVKLAMSDKTCIVTLGDGAYIFNVPTACHYVSQRYDLPLLIIIINNGTWGASKRTVLEQFPDGWAATANEFPFCDLTPSPKYEAVVSAFDGYGESVEEPSQLLSALRRAIEIVRTEKKTVVLNVICAGPGAPRG
jgi:acetolactate synthase-1/2/3 large subunit